MIVLLLMHALAAQPPAARSLALCKTALARQAEGEIASMQVDSAASSRKGQVIRGRLTLILRMGPASAGTMRAHHLGTAELNYRCRISHGRVREAALNVANP